MTKVFAWMPWLGQLERRKVHVFDDVEGIISAPGSGAGVILFWLLKFPIATTTTTTTNILLVRPCQEYRLYKSGEAYGRYLHALKPCMRERCVISIRGGHVLEPIVYRVTLESANDYGNNNLVLPCNLTAYIAATFCASTSWTRSPTSSENLKLHVSAIVPCFSFATFHNPVLHFEVVNHRNRKWSSTHSMLSHNVSG